MRSLVVYDSQFGNTERVAQVIAKVLDEFGPARAAHVHETASTQLRDVELLLLGCPTQAWNATSAMRTFIERLPIEVLRAPKVVCFDTRMHVPRWMARFAGPQLAKQLKKLGVMPVASTEGFFVKEREGPLEDGEVQRAAAWARQVAEQVLSREVRAPLG